MTVQMPEESPIEQIIKMLMAAQQPQQQEMAPEVLLSPEQPPAYAEPEMGGGLPPELMQLLAQFMPQQQPQPEQNAIQRRLGGPGMSGAV